MSPRPAGPDSTTHGHVSREQRWTRTNPCPICGGHQGRPRGRGERCFGFRSEDGRYAHCTREEFAGSLPQNGSSGAFAHWLKGDCECGTSHGLGQTGRSTERSRGEGVRKPQYRVLDMYDYRSEDGRMLFQVERLEPKTFRQRRPDGTGGWIYNLDGVERVLYRLPELLCADPDRPVYIPEGEKDVETLRELGFVATCNPGGAGKWSLLGSGMHEHFRGREVVIIPDNDGPGEAHAEQVAEALQGIAGSVRILKLPGMLPKGDVSDWVAAERRSPQSDGLDPQQIDLEIQEKLDSLTQQTPPLRYKGRGRAAPERAPGHRETPTSEFPPLPQGVLPDLAGGISDRSWIDQYVEYAEAVSPMTPRMFHVSAGLWLPSAAIARRLVLRMPFGDIYPNLFVCWIAPTTLYRKTTALDVAKGIARRVFPHLMAPQETTPEAMLSDMAGAEPANLEKMSKTAKDQWEAGRRFAAQRGLIMDEMSGLLAGAGRDYNAGLVEAYLRFYDCDPEYCRSTRTQGRIVVRNAYLAFLGASTPTALAPHLLAERLWSMGWWPRFALLTPETERPAWHVPSHAELPRSLVDALRCLMDRLPAGTWPDPPSPISVSLGDGTFDVWSEYDRAVSHELLTEALDHRLWGSYGRLPVQALKVAICLAALDWGEHEGPVIEQHHMLRALEITESWRASAHRVLIMATQTDYHALGERIRRVLARAEPKGATRRDICRAMSDKKPDEIEDVLRQMVAAGEVEPHDCQPGPKGGRPTDKYRLARG